ncbi:MAG: hypothetical protein AAFX06_20855 [Planctomycetota bacterium]
MEFSLNARLLGAAYGSPDGTGIITQQPDEHWDAADFENMYLAWQPSDHRRAAFQTIHGDSELDRQLGQHVIPSFHRPAVINYLMNAPIRLPGEGPAVTRRLADIKNTPSVASPFFDDQRLFVLMTRLRRATMRPLNFPHLYGATATSDLNADGNPFDGAPFFTGSNDVPVLNAPIDMSVGLTGMITQVENLGRWLINGPWDVDNDGDGLPDSVWVDFNLPTITSPEGLLLKPMIAPLVEDNDGKVNVNYAGSYNQLLTERFLPNPITGPTSQTQYDATTFFNVNNFLGISASGGGIGPAEIDFSHLFRFEQPFSRPTLPTIPPREGPLATTQIFGTLNHTGAGYLNGNGTINFAGELLRTRYGNLLNVRYGGPVHNYTYPDPANAFVHLPGTGTAANAMLTSDLLARIPFPNREPTSHTLNSVRGRPVDLAGIMTVQKDPTGEHRFTRLPLAGDDAFNHPYEFGANEVRGDDKPFSPAELVDFLKGGPLNGRLSQLLDDVADENEALRRLLTTESRSLDSPELIEDFSVMHLFAERFSGLAQDQHALHIQRMLALELRKGSKLNLNRQIGNVLNDNSDPFGLTDENAETNTVIKQRSAGPPAVFEANTANNRRSGERAFPQLNATSSPFINQSNVAASYGSTTFDVTNGLVLDFDGIDENGDGVLDTGTPFDLDGTGMPADFVRLKSADGAELLARHLYCLMFALIVEDPTASPLVPDFPYPTGLSDDFTMDPAIRDRYVAQRIAQWAVNVVDYRDVDSKCTRLRYDPNPFDSTGFDLETAARNTVWGMERPELQLTETLAVHDKRQKRDLTKAWSVTGVPPTPDMTISQDGESGRREPPMGVIADSDMDQFRIPQATAMIEIESVRPAVSGTNNQPSLPRDLYGTTTAGDNAIDLGRVVTVPGVPAATSPVWRVAVGQPTLGNSDRSTRFVFDFDRLRELNDSDLEYPEYLTQDTSLVTVPPPPPTWGMGRDLDPIDDEWAPVVGYTAEVRSSRRRPTDPARTEYVTLADRDLNPFTNDSPSFRVSLERFVWFTTEADLAPNDGARVTTDPSSGMRPDNVFFRRGNKATPLIEDPMNAGTVLNLDNGAVENARMLLQPGQRAVIAPRALTHFGQRANTDGDVFNYEPSDNRFEFRRQGAIVPALFRLDLFTHGAAPPVTPRWLEEGSVTDPYALTSVLPIVCESLYPHEVSPGLVPDWETYATNVPATERVDMGFNISAPLPGVNYYRAPTHNIYSGSGAFGQVTTTAGAPTPGDYPLVDGYRQYFDGASGMPIPAPGTLLADPADPNGVHDDVPFDHKNPLGNPGIEHRFRTNHTDNPPLITNGWAQIGTHQEAVTVFLQRLADPTSPWDPIDNPYLTVDFMPMDLTTMNGEEDARDFVDNNGVNEPVDPESELIPDPPNQPRFMAEVLMDTRRKVPDRSKERATTQLLPTVATPGTNLANFERAVIVHRPRLSHTTNRLRATTGVNPSGPNHWDFRFGSMWNTNRTYVATVDTTYTPNSALQRTAMDTDTAGFRQTMGFLNREFGEPVLSNSPRSGTFGIGGPELVYYSTPTWMNREFQSPLEVMNVPATSRTRILEEFGPGTVLQDAGAREVPVPFEHLLGFRRGYAGWRAADETGILGFVEDAAPGSAANDRDTVTGSRAGFETILDFVDTGPVWFDSQHWFDPQQVFFRQDVGYDTNPDAAFVRRNERFNRCVETLQPPYNYIGRHRTPGKINPNTMPDFVRKGPSFQGLNSHFLDGYEDVTDNMRANKRLLQEDPSTPYVGLNIANLRTQANRTNELSANPQNSPQTSDGFTSEFINSKLFGNGSVYRSLAWGISNSYELDDAYEVPSTMGQNNQYEWQVASSFGRSFKGFIESRRGYSMTAPGGTNYNGNLTAFRGNPELDFRYPTRFAGVFATAQAAATPSVQRFMQLEDRAQTFLVPDDPMNAMNTPSDASAPAGLPRRTHDMTMLRPHPDFDLRTMSEEKRDDFLNDETDTRYSLSVEADASMLTDGTNGINDPGLSTSIAGTVAAEVSNIRMPMVNTGLFDRPDAELHMNLGNLDRDPYFRHRGAARMANVTTNHSNVFTVRLTVGYFVVDPTTGAPGAEYVTDTGDASRTRATYVIDRTVPVGFLRGRDLDSKRCILFEEVGE